MIRLKPDKLTKTIYKNIDFDILQNICNIVFYSICNNKKSYVLNIKTVKGDECCYSNNRNRITLKITSNLRNDSIFIKYFLHEFRHFLQDKAFRIAFNNSTYDDSTHEAYISSPLEVDVSNFLKDHTIHFCKLYGNMKIYKDKLMTSEACKRFTGSVLTKNS